MERNLSSLFNAKIVDHENGVRVYEPSGSASVTPMSQGVTGWSSSVTHQFHAVAGSGGGGVYPGNSSGESFKRKRGRPRKYGTDGTPVLGVSPLSTSPAAPPPSTGIFSPATHVAATVAAEGAKRARGRPRGSTNKRPIKALGSTGTGFMPHVIAVETGEDVSAKIMEFSQQSRRAICVLSANGAIANASLCQADTHGSTLTYEGRFEILSLSGSFLLTQSGGGQHRQTSSLSVSLADPDGHVIGGGVAGALIAASPVQVIVGSFSSQGQGKKGTLQLSPSGPSASGAKDLERLASLAGSFSA
ncbi:AT-hook motif nuclear-localized protein 10-like [Zingiber officinale]|uniref:AT-hook motif nuclear-localized protein 10-like n=1 Tax=Zingiber officinale TaxID=94328 RepID=UPI001C4B2365|nr:AT-hook motif nuclear-localized protein 10-like [Zingiber officinale]XP_042400449.1 AT-hook motif nuclear-localized protein 10-like [Zingiber officinale]XP_042400455.1 AT-hook motif nuclear-localized protein 10-like [Zingiber officinale]XP_042400462.1 AT-hook motif nuclear-localized protein 10-like [Zingiber officinale]